MDFLATRGVSSDKIKIDVRNRSFFLIDTSSQTIMSSNRTRTLSCTTTASFDIPLDEVVEAVFEQRQELLQSIEELHQSIKFFNGHYSIGLTDWHNVPGEERTYISLVGMFDVHDESYLLLRVVEGYKTNDEGNFFEGDAFLDIKVDRESLTQAIAAMKTGTIPLYNKGVEITESTCPYALIYDEE